MKNKYKKRTRSGFDNNIRRKRIITKFTLFVFTAYCITQLASLIAKVSGFSSISYSEILFVTGTTLGSTSVFLIIIRIKKTITTNFANFTFFGQFVVWLISYSVWFFTLREIRVMALFFALMALIFLLSNSNFYQSLVIAITATTIQIAGSYYAIYHLNQPGSFWLEVFMTLCFLPSAVFISYLAEHFSRQRKEIKLAKRTAEKNRDALWGEMQLAKKIQTVLLPCSPEIQGYRISAYMEPADEVGGDYYDIINVEGTDWIAIGDVSGHGVSAGLIMMMVQTSIRSILTNQPDIKPSILLEAVNKSLSENIKKISNDKYMTITVIAAHRNGKFAFSGLHQDIMIFRARTGIVEIVETNGLWLGMLQDMNRISEDSYFKLEKNDVILLYTDGITEAMDSEEKMYSSSRLSNILKENGQNDPDDIKKNILSSMKKYTPRDDLTLLIIKHL